MADISDLDWAMHIKMDYAQNLRKNSIKAKKKDSVNFFSVSQENPDSHSTMSVRILLLQTVQDSACQFSRSVIYYMMQNYDKICDRIAQKMPIRTLSNLFWRGLYLYVHSIIILWSKRYDYI